MTIKNTSDLPPPVEKFVHPADPREEWEKLASILESECCGFEPEDIQKALEYLKKK